jgi:type IV secretory pathway VirB9-like protein
MTIPLLQKVPLWVPSQIYDDGVAVYIHFPHLDQNKAPIFFVLDEQHRLEAVNYRVNQDGYQIKQLFTKGVLMKRVGSHQEKIIITKK